jgi:hypothetical protein
MEHRVRYPVPNLNYLLLTTEFFILGGDWMEEKDKLLGIENYLKELLPGCGIEITWDSESSRHVFRVDAPSGETKHTIAVSSEFVSDNALEDIVICLRLYNLKGYLEIWDILRYIERRRFW